MNPIELVEQLETPILLEQGSDGFHRAKFLVTTVGQRNKNGRVYPMSIAAREASMPMRGDILGQDTHPAGTPKFTEQFLIWEKFMVEGNKEYAQAKIVPTKPDGENFLLLAQAGAMVSCSRRGIGSVKEGTVDGIKCQIVQDDYKLLGIDILPPHTQSDHNAYLYRFEAYDPKESNLMEMTSEKLREEHPEIVTEIEDAAKQSAQTQIAERDTKITELEGQVTTLTADRDAAAKLAEETQSKLAEIETKFAELTAATEELNTKLDEATTQINAFTEQVKSLKEAADARNHLLVKVKGEKAAWLILDELKDVATVADVDTKFDVAKAKCDALIENANQPTGRTVYTGNENDLSEAEKAKLKQHQDEEKRRQEVLEKSRRISKAGLS